MTPRPQACRHHWLIQAADQAKGELLPGRCKWCGMKRTWPRDPANRSVAGHTMNLWAHTDKERVRLVG